MRAAFGSACVWMASVALIAPISAAQSQRSTEARGRLESTYPGVVVHYPQRDAEGLPSSWAGAEQVLGVPMPASGAGGSEPAESPEEALTDWLDAFAGVFQGDGQIEALDLVVTSALPMRDGRVALRFDASQLFVDWSFIASPEPSPRSCTASPSRDMAARDATYYEVLVADDDNNNLSDGTPHDAEICAAFSAYGIPADIDCPEGGFGARCRADLDGDGVFSVYDFTLFTELLVESSPRADLNRDGRVDLFDQLELMRLAAQCH